MSDDSSKFATGGYVARHAADVWSEPERGCEFYIPLPHHRRGRADEILRDVARRFGGDYLGSGPS